MPMERRKARGLKEALQVAVLTCALIGAVFAGMAWGFGIFQDYYNVRQGVLQLASDVREIRNVVRGFHPGAQFPKP